MEDATLKEATEILKKLSLQNQSYFMTLVRLAEIAENGVKDELLGKSDTRSKNTYPPN